MLAGRRPAEAERLVRRRSNGRRSVPRGDAPRQARRCELIIGATLTDANLNKTDLKTASLVGVKAENAMFYGSDLSAADLSDAGPRERQDATAYLVRAKLDHCQDFRSHAQCRTA